MTTLTAILFTLLTIDCANIYGQQDTTNKGRSFSYGSYHIENIHFVIKTDILLPIISAIDKRTTSTFTGEFCFDQRHSVQFTGLLNAYSTAERNDFSLQIIPEYKFFINKKKQYTGFYTGAYLKMTNYSYTKEVNGDFPPYYTYLKYNQASLGGGLICGYQNYIKKHFVIDFLVGFGARHITGTNIIKAVNISLDNQKQTVPDVRLALNIGYKF